jgi:hypothetical protein
VVREQREQHARLCIFFCLLLAALSLPAAAQAQTFTVRLNINSTANNVFIPGFGEQRADQLTELTLSAPAHVYLASYLNNIVAGLAAADGNHIRVSRSAASHTLEINQDLEKSRIFLVFSEGNYQAIERNIGLIEQGSFLSQITPSFAYGLGMFYPLRLVLEYADIDLDGDFSLRKGSYKLAISYQGLAGTRPLISIRIV